MCPLINKMSANKDMYDKIGSRASFSLTLKLGARADLEGLEKNPYCGKEAHKPG